MPALRLVESDAASPYCGRSDDILIDLVPIEAHVVPPVLARRIDLEIVGDVWLEGRSDHWIAMDGAGRAFAVDAAGGCIPLRHEDIGAPLRKAVVAAARTAWAEEWAQNLARLVQEEAPSASPSLDTIPARALRALAVEANAVRAIACRSP